MTGRTGSVKIGGGRVVRARFRFVAVVSGGGSFRAAKTPAAPSGRIRVVLEQSDTALKRSGAPGGVIICHRILSPGADIRHAGRTMRKRREARERALQFLFQVDVNPPATPAELAATLDHFWDSTRMNTVMEARGHAATYGEKIPLPEPTAEEAATRIFADELIRGVLEHRPLLDERIKKYAKNWDLHRMAVVDRNLMRLAIYEMLHREDIPPIVSINEAVDIAKKFSTGDSGKFVNGILDQIKGEILRPARTAKDGTPA